MQSRMGVHRRGRGDVYAQPCGSGSPTVNSARSRCWDTAMCIICAGLLFSARRCIKWPPISAFQWPAILQNLPRSNWPKIAMRILTLGAMAYEWKPGELFNADALHENIKSRFPRDTLPNDPRLEHALRS